MTLARLSTTDGLAHLVLDRPDKRNALSRELIEALRERLAQARTADVRALLVTAEGPTFCAGGDVAWMEQRKDDPSATREAMEEHLGPLIEEVDAFPAPTVAAVRGAAIGAGLGLAVSCDVTIAAQESVLGATHARLGLTPDAGTSWHLTRALGPKRALDLILGAKTFSGEKADDWGLVSDAVPAGDVEEAARRRARQLAEGPTRALRTARQLVRDATDVSLVEMLRREAAAQEAMYETEDQTEGVDAFLEDREPEFTGR
jgi:enoyl-CoA hydratase/carnithine racemase